MRSRRLSLLPVLLVAGCGGRTTDSGSLGHEDSSREGEMGGAASVIESLVVTDHDAFCTKDVECGFVDSADECPPLGSVPRCTQSPEAIRECLENLSELTCDDYSMTSGRSCVPANKTPDGC